MKKQRFTVAFSFSSEKRNYVSEVANILAKQYGKDSILYDEFHKAEFARRDLGIYLPELYNKNSELIVLILAEDYLDKQWTGLEWVAIHDLLSQRLDYMIMLCRFDFATIPGIYSTAGFIECDTKTPEQLALLIKERLELMGKNTGTIDNHIKAETINKSIPNNLPRLRPFFGRTLHLTTIKKALSYENKTWGILIYGLGGIGKTSLAVYSAYTFTDKEFEQIIFVSAKETDLEVEGKQKISNFASYNFSEFINLFAREINRNDILQSIESEKPKLLFEAFRSRRILFVLDNVEAFSKENRNYLFSFLKYLPEGSKAIVTSREPIGSISETLFLEEIDLESALQIFSELSHHNPYINKCNKNELTDLYKETGGNPLLLSWTIGQLGRNECRNIKDAIELLRSCPQSNDPLEFIYGKLQSNFNHIENNILYSLTLFNLPANIDHLSKVIKLSDELIQKTISKLLNRSLVLTNQNETEFFLLPIVANFIKRSKIKNQKIIIENLTDYTFELIIANGLRKDSNYPILEKNWPLISAALSFYTEGPNDILQTVCANLTYFLEFSGRWDERLKLNEVARTKALSNNDFLNAGWRTYEDGWLYYLRNDVNNLQECAKTALNYFQTANAGFNEISYAKRLQGFAYLISKDYDQAIMSFKECFLLWQNISLYSLELANSLNDIGRAYRYSQNFLEAEVFFQKALDMSINLNYNDGIATYTGNLANVALDQEHWEEAEIRARDALELAEKLGRKLIIGNALVYIGRALIGQKRYREAITYLQESIAIYTHLSSPRINEANELLIKCKQSL